MYRHVLLAAVVGALVACGGSGEDEEKQGVIPGHMVESMEKANDVEDMLKQAEQERRSQADE